MDVGPSGFASDEENSDRGTPSSLPDIVHDESHFPVSLFGYRQSIDLRFNSNFREVLLCFSNLERYCDAPTESLYERSNKCSIDVSLEEAFHFPQRISGRIPTDGERIHQISLRNLKNMWCRLVAHYFEWIAGIPELKFFCDRDKIKLVTRQLCKVICLTVSYWTYEQNYDGVIFGSGIYFDPQQCPEGLIKNYVGSLSNVIHNGVVSTFRTIRLLRDEYILMKLVMLFEDSHDVPLSEDGRMLVDMALNKYRTALVEQSKYAHPELNHMESTSRMALLFGVMPYMELLSQLDDYHLSEITIHNSGNMMGRLTSEIHLNSILQ
uniref:NR LBD domain-containing protein n=1 Tax=Heterorhabditis bacteriophora TaxID=37862 RepID=A0A1I7XRS4_HETBA